MAIVYDWASLPVGAKIVDVGAGLGVVSLELATVRPDITYVLEDRVSVVSDAQKASSLQLQSFTSAQTCHVSIGRPPPLA